LKHDLAKEVTSWVAEGIISTEQAAAICSSYGLDYHNLSRRSYGYRILVGLGYLFIGLALITLIGANWDGIPRAVRMIGLIALTLATNLLGLYKFRRENESAVTWFFLGGLFYGASIMLIAQIYHIDEHYPDGIFWWAMGVLPVAVLTESALIMILSVCLGFTWFIVESSLNFYPALFPIFMAAMLWRLSRGRQSNTIFLLLAAALVLWAEYTMAWLLSDKPGFQTGGENVALFLGLLLAFHALAKWLVQRKESVPADYGTLLGIWVLRFAIVTLFVFSFYYPWQALISAGWKMPGLAIAVSSLLVLLAVLLAYKAKESMIFTSAFGVLFIAGLVALTQVHDGAFALGFQFADNIALVATGIWLIIIGIRDSVSRYFYLGVFTILTTGLLRYIALVGDYIGTAVLFAILAVIILGAAKYWRSYSAKAGTMP
jgi:uncharacterized membrane protein